MNRMFKTTTLTAMALALLLAGAVSYAGDTGKTAGAQSWTGWITDEACGARNANAEGKTCALKCAQSGSKLVLYVDGEKSLVALDNQDEAMKHLGHPVTVTGTLEDGVIKVQKIEEKKS